MGINLWSEEPIVTRQLRVRLVAAIAAVISVAVVVIGVAVHFQLRDYGAANVEHLTSTLMAGYSARLEANLAGDQAVVDSLARSTALSPQGLLRDAIKLLKQQPSLSSTLRIAAGSELWVCWFDNVGRVSVDHTMRGHTFPSNYLYLPEARALHLQPRFSASHRPQVVVVEEEGWSGPLAVQRPGPVLVIVYTRRLYVGRRWVGSVAIEESLERLLGTYLESLVGLGAVEAALEGSSKHGVRLRPGKPLVLVPTDQLEVERKHGPPSQRLTRVPLGGTPFFLATLLTPERLTDPMHAESALFRFRLGALILMLVAVWVIATRMTGPLRQLHAAALRVIEGDMTVRLPYLNGGDETTALGLAFNAMMDTLVEREAQLTVIAAEQQRVVAELALAREIQVSMLGELGSPAPGWDWYACSFPSRMVGGDLYDLIQLSPDEVGVLVGDVSGKGTGAALLMAQALITMRILAPIHRSPATCVGRCNSLLASHSSHGAFVSLLYGVLNLRTGHFVYCNAGHLPPLVDGVAVEAPPQLLTGISPCVVYHDDELTLAPGADLCLFTDGVTEARNLKGAFLELEGLASMLAHHDPRLGVRERVKRLIAEVFCYRGSASEGDDVTVVMLRRKPFYQGTST